MKILPEETGSVISKFVMYITLPATILKVFLSSNLDKKLFILHSLLFSVCGYNVGLFSYPFIQSVYGDNGLILLEFLMLFFNCYATLLPAPLVAVIYSNERGLNAKFASVFVSITVVIGIFFMIILLK